MMADRMYYSKEAQQRAQIERSLIAVCFLGIGLSIGTAIAMLFAPAKGETVRDEVSNRANEFFNSGRETAQNVWDNVRERAEEGVEAINRR